MEGEGITVRDRERLPAIDQARITWLLQEEKTPMGN